MLNTGPELLTRLRQEIQRPEVDESTPDERLYALLTEAQVYWYDTIMSRVPEALRYVDFPMVTRDGGVSYQYGIVPDAVIPKAPGGHLTIRHGAGSNARTLIPDDDYERYPGGIKFSGNQPRSFAQGLFWTGVPEPGEISATIPPTIQPEGARILLVYHAAGAFASLGGLRDPQPYFDQETRHWATLIERLRTSHHMMGGGFNERVAAWWQGIDTGSDYQRYNGSR